MPPLLQQEMLRLLRLPLRQTIHLPLPTLPLPLPLVRLLLLLLLERLRRSLAARSQLRPRPRPRPLAARCPQSWRQWQRACARWALSARQWRLCWC